MRKSRFSEEQILHLLGPFSGLSGYPPNRGKLTGAFPEEAREETLGCPARARDWQECVVGFRSKAGNDEL